MYTKKQKIEVTLVFLLIIFATEVFLFFATRQGIIELYVHRQQSSWVLPIRWIIPVWTVLYTLIGVSGAIIWTSHRSQIRNLALGAWVLQAILNILWPLSFFNIGLPLLTPITISILFMTLLVQLFYSFLINRTAALLILPFLLMIGYQTLYHWIFFILNISIK